MGEREKEKNVEVRERERIVRERECVCVYVCVRERERACACCEGKAVPMQAFQPTKAKSDHTPGKRSASRPPPLTHRGWLCLRSRAGGRDGKKRVK